MRKGYRNLVALKPGCVYRFRFMYDGKAYGECVGIYRGIAWSGKFKPADDDDDPGMGMVFEELASTSPICNLTEHYGPYVKGFKELSPEDLLVYINLPYKSSAFTEILKGRKS